MSQVLEKTTYRQQVIACFEAIKPLDVEEERAIKESCAWLHSGAPFIRVKKPDVPPKHLVCYFIVYDKAQHKVLLGEHVNSGLLLPTGGHVELDEHPKHAVIRECQEELQIEANFLLEVPFFHSINKTVGKTAGHYDVNLWYLLAGSIEQAYQFDPREFTSMRWYGFDEIPYARADKHMRRVVQKLEHLKI